jgi:hypothetical protein
LSAVWSRRHAWGPLAGLLLALAGWLWPIGVGARMPVGGDVTRFSMGLMAELGRAYRAGRLPLWNDLWGYGFPGLAESQMGVYYPPHLVLYGLLGTEAAYTASLVLHTFWGGAGAFWAARRFGASPLGAALGGFAWAASGFFVIHLPHQWGYTVGSWMPWAWGLAWSIARGGAERARKPLLLAGVLALQILPGHFQLAFHTEVGVVLLAVWAVLDRPCGWRPAIRGGLTIAAAMAAVVPLAALQLGPTFELSRLAESRRDFEYLSSFSASLMHLASYFLPGLFHRSPLWRPIAWDPFRVTPEEHLVYVGLVPLFLAIGAIGNGWRRDPAIRALGVLWLAAILLSLGPRLPGFSWLIRLPGFSFFRAPARWGLAADLAGSLLAARGFTLLVEGAWSRPRRALFAFAAVGLGVAAVWAGFLGWRLQNVSPSNEHRVLALADAWEALIRDGSRRGVQPIERPADRSLVVSGLLRQGLDPRTARLRDLRWAVLRDELGPSAGLLLALGLLAAIGSRPRLLRGGLIVLALGDLLAWDHALRPVYLAPIRPLVKQSPVLGYLASQPRGTRIVDGEGNLAMTAGAAPIFGYRTLDRPIMGELTWMASHPPWRALRLTAEAQRAAGLGLGIEPLWDGRSPKKRPGDVAGVPRIRDPQRAFWDLGPRGRALLGPDADEFLIWRPSVAEAGRRAWLIPTPTAFSEQELLRPGDDARRVLATLREARPLARRAAVPERIEVDLDGEEPGYVLITQLDDPEWAGTWIGPEGERPAGLVRLFANAHGAGWIGAKRPAGPGPWTLQLTYRGRAASRGLAVSLVAWLVWALAYWRLGRHPAHSRKEGVAT